MRPLPDDEAPEAGLQAWDNWDESRSCTEPSEREWTEHLYGLRPARRSGETPGLSIMTATAFRALRGLSDAFSTDDAAGAAQSHWLRRFRKLLAARAGAYDCRSFEALCKKDLRRFARRLGVQKLAEGKKLVFVSPIAGGDQEDYTVTLDDLGAVEPAKSSHRTRAELRALLERALQDLPAGDREICAAISIDSEELAEEDATAGDDAERKASSRALRRYRALLLGHQATESAEGRRRIEKALHWCIDDEQDRKFAAAHLLEGKSLDQPKADEKAMDKARFRFLGIVQEIVPVIDPERVRALDLLPDRHRSLVVAVFFRPRPLEEVAREQGWKLQDAYLRIRAALHELRVLLDACVRSDSAKGRASLEQLADSAARPGRFLIRRILIEHESLHLVAADYKLSEEQCRDSLLHALQ
jgi:DNA-directed RNA polymerase specialized sigma24 family protein